MFQPVASCPDAGLGAGCRQCWRGINSAGHLGRMPAESFSSHTGSFSFGATLRFGVSPSLVNLITTPGPAWEAEESQSSV